MTSPRNYTGRFRAFLGLALVLTLSISAACSGAPLTDEVTVSFDGADTDLSASAVTQFIGGTPAHVADGVSGSALRLATGQCLHVTGLDFGASAGTISLWVRPAWHYYSNDGRNLTSHTLVSGRRANGSYLVLSDGWWEDNGGADYTYFVVDNEALANVKSAYRYNAGRWTHVAVVWSNADGGSISLYLDGSLAARKKGYAGGAALRELYLGCDHGTPLRANRWADADFDEITVADRAYDERKIASLANRQDKGAATWVRRQLAAAPPAARSTEVLIQNRVVFDEGPAEWQTPEKTDALIARLKRAGVNVYVPCVWHGDGTRYPSSVAPAARYKGKGDPLRYLIEVAHANGIEIHPWFTIALRTANILPEFYDEHTAPKAFNVYDEDFRKFIVGVVLEVVRNYDVDGINLDYIRTVGVPRGPLVASDYRRRYNRSLEADQKNYDSKGGLEKHLQEFVDDTVLDILRPISSQTRALKPHVVISIDGHPAPSTMHPSRQGRRELRWLQEDLIDVVFAMSYDAIPDVDGLEHFVREIPAGKQVIMIVGAFEKHLKGSPPRDPAAVADLVRLASQTSSDGVAIYPLSRLTDRHLSLLAEGPFRTPARSNLSATRPAASEPR